MSDSAVVEILLRAKDESHGAFESLRGHLEGLHESFSRIKDIALGDILGEIGTAAIEHATDALKEFGVGMIEVNADMESLRNRLNILYGSAAEGQQAFAFLQQNETHVPFDVTSIVSASTTLTSFGDDITEVLPRLENLAGAMGVSLPTAAQSLTDAQSGLFRMMSRDMRVSKEELEQFGLKVEANGHVIQSTLIPAFERLVDTKFAGGIAAQANTFNGLMSSLKSQMDYAKMNTGSGIFAVVKQQLGDLVHFMQDNPAKVQQFELGIGAALGRAAVSVVNFSRAVMTALPAVLNVFGNLWHDVQAGAGIAFSVAGQAAAAFGSFMSGRVAPVVGAAAVLFSTVWNGVGRAVSTALPLVSAILSGFLDWFRGTALPTFETLIGTISLWWDDHADQVRTVFNNVIGYLRDFASYLVEQSKNVMTVLGGVFQVGWGFVQIIMASALALLSGDWSKFGADFDNGTNTIMKGLINGMAGMLSYVGTFFVNLVGMGSKMLLPIADALMGPWTKLAQGVRAVWKEIGQIVGEGVGYIVEAAATMDKHILDALNKVMQGFGNLLSHVPGWAHPGISDAQIKGMQQGTALGTIDPKKAGADTTKTITDWFNKSAPGIDPWQQIKAGISQDQAKKDIDAAQQGILAPFLADIENRRKALIAQYHLDDKETPGKGHQYASAAQQRGKGLLDQLNEYALSLVGGIEGGKGSDPMAAIKAKLGDKFASVWKDLNAPGGFDWKAFMAQFTGPGAGLPGYGGGKLPVGGYGAGDTAAAGGAAGPSYTFPAIAQNLGQLAASFGGTRVTPGGGGGEQEKMRQLERTNTDLHHTVASLQAQLSQRSTEENLLRQQLREFELARGGIQELVQRNLPKPQPASPVSMRPALAIR